jgi:hypothetical protein
MEAKRNKPCLVTKLHMHLYNISCHVNITVLGAWWKYNYTFFHKFGLCEELCRYLVKKQGENWPKESNVI